MAITPIKTKYPGVTYIEVSRPTGGTEKSFYVTYRDRSTGKLKNISVGRQFRDDMSAARAFIIRGELIEGKRKTRKDQRTEDAGRITLKKLWEAYKDVNTHKASIKGSGYSAANHLHALFERIPTELTTADVEALRAGMEEKGYAPQTVKHALALLRRLLRFGVKKELCAMPANIHFEMPRVDNIKTELLTQDQLQQLFAVLDADEDQSMASLMRLALATGMRRGALLALQWDDVDFERGFITLRGEEAKNEITARIPINPMARQILENTPVVAGSPYVFPNPSGGKRCELRRFTKRIQDKAELPKGFRPLHGLRHTFASFLASSGEVDLYTLQKLLTHHSPQMTARYAHLADEAMHRAANVATGLFTAPTAKALVVEETASRPPKE